jgi:DNA-binding transcriptional LysR family regulator
VTDDLADLTAFLTVAREGGFRRAARASGTSPSRLGDAIRRLEGRLGVRLLNRTTRSVTPTEAGARLLERLAPALGEVQSALEVVNDFRDRPAGRLRLNVPIMAARLVLPHIVPPFLAKYPDITIDVTAEERLVDVVAEGYDAGIRFEKRLEQDMVAVPIGPRHQRLAASASPAYLDRRGRPKHPRELLEHECLRGRFMGGPAHPWAFVRRGETVRVEPKGPLIFTLNTSTDLAVEAAIAGSGIVYLLEAWLRPYLDRGDLEPVLERWWPSFSGAFLYYPGRKHLPVPLRTFVDFIKSMK